MNNPVLHNCYQTQQKKFSSMVECQDLFTLNYMRLMNCYFCFSFSKDQCDYYEIPLFNGQTPDKCNGSNATMLHFIFMLPGIGWLTFVSFELTVSYFIDDTCLLYSRIFKQKNSNYDTHVTSMFAFLLLSSFRFYISTYHLTICKTTQAYTRPSTSALLSVYPYLCFI